MRDQRGFVTMPILLMFLIIAFSAFTILGVSAFGVRKNAVMTYQWFGEALNFAVDAVTFSRDITATDIADKTPEARQWFTYAFSRMLDATTDGVNFNSQLPIYDGPIKLTGFRYVPPGTAVYGGNRTATPGYEAVIEVPVSVNVPFIGRQHITIPMRQVAVVKPTATAR